MALPFKIDNDFFKRFNVLSAFVLLTLELIDLQRIDEDLVLLCGDRVVLVFSFRDVCVVS